MKDLRESVRRRGDDRAAAFSVVSDLINCDMMQGICGLHYEWYDDYQEYKREPAGSHETFESFLGSEWIDDYPWNEFDQDDPESLAEMTESWEDERKSWLRSEAGTMAEISQLLDQADEIAAEFNFPFSRELALVMAKDQADSNPKWDESRC